MTNQHAITRFSCGVDGLDIWLQRRAMQNQTNGASRTVVACQGRRVVAYYALIRDASMRVLHAAETIGIRGLITHALTPVAKSFYEQIGFDVSPLDPMTLMIKLPDLAAAFKGTG